MDQVAKASSPAPIGTMSKMILSICKASSREVSTESSLRASSTMRSMKLRGQGSEVIGTEEEEAEEEAERGDSGDRGAVSKGRIAVCDSGAYPQRSLSSH
jgi:hypothetical protein